MIEGLFPCPIGAYELDRPITDSEMNYLKGAQLEENEGNMVSTKGDVLHNDAMIELTKFIGNSLEEYCVETFNFDMNRVQIYVTQSWTNRTQPGEYHHTHSHQNSILSGVFYFDGNDDDVIEFWNSKHWLGDRWAFERIKNNHFNSDVWQYPAKVGTLLLFPSHLEHSVPELEAEKDRYSLSFNTFFKGELGLSEERTQLIL
jgi:uncharacterized protein (TIGR02466 family)